MSAWLMRGLAWMCAHLSPRARLGVAVGALVGLLAAAKTAAVGLRITAFALRLVTFSLRRRCPDCAERVRYEARVCRFCGHRLRTAPAARRSAPITSDRGDGCAGR
ncbi:MAG TPA: hypothetical protein VHX88_22220 [Solirubrobacteraceae bacterium]|jgi:hypothetical protein|nr:hypothetical protein [Solirubrobacteraceae bacterium]